MCKRVTLITNVKDFEKRLQIKQGISVKNGLKLHVHVTQTVVGFVTLITAISDTR